MTRAAQILETEQAMREQRPAEAVVAAQAEPRAVAAARVAGLIPTVDSLSSADVMPLDDGEPLRDEVAGKYGLAAIVGTRPRSGTRSRVTAPGRRSTSRGSRRPAWASRLCARAC